MTKQKAIYREVTEDVLMIILGVALFILPAGVYRIICLVALILVAVYSCLEGVSRIVANAERYNRLKEENHKLSNSLSLANAEKAPVERVTEVLPTPPDIPMDSFDANIDTIQRFIAGMYKDQPLPNTYKTFFKQIKDLSDAESSLAAFKEKVTGPFIEGLREMDMPVSEENKKRVIQDLVSFALLMLDYIDTYRYNINNTPEQLLSIKAALGEITEEAAYEAAKTSTELADETPRYIRAMKSSVESLQTDDKHFLYSGYKL